MVVSPTNGRPLRCARTTPGCRRDHYPAARNSRWLGGRQGRTVDRRAQRFDIIGLCRSISHRLKENQQLDADCGSGGRWFESTQLYQALTASRGKRVGNGIFTLCRALPVGGRVITGRRVPPSNRGTEFSRIGVPSISAPLSFQNPLRGVLPCAPLLSWL